MLRRPRFIYTYMVRGVCVFRCSASSQYLIAEGYFKLLFIRTGLGAIVNIVLKPWLIPAYGHDGRGILLHWWLMPVATFFIMFIPKVSKQGIMMLKSLFLLSLFQKIIKR
jgi:O-antigen/teichoic acid export membrane protein